MDQQNYFHLYLAQFLDNSACHSSLYIFIYSFLFQIFTFKFLSKSVVIKGLALFSIYGKFFFAQKLLMQISMFDRN